MTEKMLTFPLSYPPLLPPQTLGMGSIGQNSAFSRTASTQINKDICTRTTCTDPVIFVRGGGSRPLNLFYSLQRGSNDFIKHFPGGGGSNFLPGGVQMLISIETHITKTCDFPGGLEPLSPAGSSHGQCGILARIGSDEPVRPPFKLRNSKC